MPLSFTTREIDPLSPFVESKGDSEGPKQRGLRSAIYLRRGPRRGTPSCGSFALNLAMADDDGSDDGGALDLQPVQPASKVRLFPGPGRVAGALAPHAPARGTGVGASLAGESSTEATLHVRWWVRDGVESVPRLLACRHAF